MYEAMFTAASGIRGQQQRLDVIADNMSNVNTNAFKASRLNFKDILYVAGDYPYADQAENQQKGHGVKTASVSRIFSTGNLVTTERQLDFAIEGEGFFELMDRNGGYYYTRAGNFYLSEIGGQHYLVNGSGNFVLSDAGEPVIMPADAMRLNIDATGHISFTGADGANTDGGNIALRTFVNPDGLSSLGGCNYSPTEASGEPVAAQRAGVRQGVLESSNVDIAQEMTRMIRTQRALSFSSRALTTADQMEGIANNMRR